MASTGVVIQITINEIMRKPVSKPPTIAVRWINSPKVRGGKLVGSGEFIEWGGWIREG